jgi:hypothetical protein
MLTVEDGTGVAGADAYVDIDDVAAYADSYGKVAWDTLTTDAQREMHIRRATQFIDNKYPFPGTPLKSTQGLFFPVEELFVRGHEVEGIPRQLKDAVCELATISVTTDLQDSAAARTYTYRKVKVGDLEKVERFETDQRQNIFYSVEMLLTPLLGAQLGPGVRVLSLRRA